MPAGHPLWRDEIFGSVACVRSFDTEDGLAAIVAGEDTGEVQRIARALRAGIVWQNEPLMVSPEAGWGGFGRHGIGRAMGLPGVPACQQAQHLPGRRLAHGNLRPPHNHRLERNLQCADTLNTFAGWKESDRRIAEDASSPFLAGSWEGPSGMTSVDYGQDELGIVPGGRTAPEAASKRYVIVG